MCVAKHGLAELVADDHAVIDLMQRRPEPADHDSVSVRVKRGDGRRPVLPVTRPGLEISRGLAVPDHPVPVRARYTWAGRRLFRLPAGDTTPPLISSMAHRDR